jgi:5-methylcytosine-specific restriction endonuclease McrA
MTLRPCLDCGGPCTGTRCPDCRPPDTKASARDRGYRTAWDKLSRRARKLQPWCTSCGAVDDLTLDHIIPISVEPELALAVENGQVLCRPCNGRRGNTYTHADAAAVLTRLRDAYRRHPTRKGRERIIAAQRAAQGWGDTVGRPTQDSAARRRARYTPLDMPGCS